MLSDSILSQFRDLVVTHLGLKFPKEHQSDLEYRLNQVASAFDFADPEACVNWLLTVPLTQKQMGVLAHHLTVGETYFFRDKHAFEALRLEILPTLIRAWKQTGIPPTIWSAGCCTGEEPYSIAMLLYELCPELAGQSVRILATDINPTFLCKAETGVYGEWSFRETPVWVKLRYFRKKSPTGHYEILPFIKKLVAFTPSNLANPDSLPGLTTSSVNLILCRNVLMYFDPEVAQQVVRFFHRVLADDGWLLVSPSELSQVVFAPFQLTTVAGAMCYTKHIPPARSWFEQLELIPAPEEVTIQQELTLEGLAHKRQDKRDKPDLDKGTRGQGDKGTQTDGLLSPLPTGCHSGSHRQWNGPFVPLSPQLLVSNRLNFPYPGAYEGLASAQDSPVPEPETHPSPISPELLYTQALEFYEARTYEAALKTLEALLAVEPTNTLAMILCGRTYANQGLYDQALYWCQMAIDTDKLNTTAYYLLATIRQEQNQIEAAVTALKQAMYIEPDFVPAHFTLGVIALGQGWFQASDKHLLIALSLLKGYDPQAILPKSGGMIAGQLAATIQSILGQSR